MKSILSLMCIMMIFTLPVSAAGLFTVENIQVDVTAASAIEARNQAFGEAQTKAFKELSARLLEEGEAESIQTPDSDTISTMINDYEVTNERLSTVRYVGTYTFRFDEVAVRRLFTGSGQRYTTTQSKPLLILPFYKKGANTILWSPANSWMHAWASTKTHNPLIPLVVPIGDLNDVRDINDQHSMHFSPHKLSNMLARYNAGEAVIVMAVADEHLSLVDHPNQPATGYLNITIYRTDRGMSEHADQFSVSAKPDQTLSDLMAHAVARTQKALTKDWKSRTLTTPGEVATLDVKVPIQSLGEWTAIRRSLKDTPIITQIMLKSLTPKAAMITLEFQGNAQRLALALDQVNLMLAREEINYMAMSSEQPFAGRPYIITRKYRTPAQRQPNAYAKPYVQPYSSDEYARTF